MRFGISHNGFVYTVEQDSVWERFKVTLEIEFEFLNDPEDEWSWETIRDEIAIGTIDMRNSHFYEWFEATTRWNGNRLSWDTHNYGINDAVAFLADNYRPCAHGISSRHVVSTLWNCDDCGQDFKMFEDDE